MITNTCLIEASFEPPLRAEDDSEEVPGEELLPDSAEPLLFCVACFFAGRGDTDAGGLASGSDEGVSLAADVPALGASPERPAPLASLGAAAGAAVGVGWEEDAASVVCTLGLAAAPSTMPKPKNASASGNQIRRAGRARRRAKDGSAAVFEDDASAGPVMVVDVGAGAPVASGASRSSSRRSRSPARAPHVMQ
jgi:hypothetical protein